MNQGPRDENTSRKKNKTKQHEFLGNLRHGNFNGTDFNSWIRQISNLCHSSNLEFCNQCQFDKYKFRNNILISSIYIM